MSTEYSGTTTAGFPAAVTLPSVGDPDKLASINDGLSDLADRTKWLTGVADFSAALNWHNPILKDATDVVFDTSEQRVHTGLQGIFFDPFRGYWWATGSATAKQVYVGDTSYMFAHDTGVVPSLIFTMGVVANNGKVILVSNEEISNPDFVETVAQSDDAGVLGSMTWASRTIDAAPAFTARCGDIVKTDTGRIVIVGYTDSTQTAWVSDNHGTTWTPKNVGALVNVGDGLDRVVCGKDNLLVAFVSESAINGGDTFWYSTDNGNTWSSRTGLAFDNIRDACYSDALDRWFFSHDGDIEVTDDPIAGSFTTVTPETDEIPSGDVMAIACVGSALIASVTLDPAWAYLLMSLNAGADWQLVHRVVAAVDVFGLGASQQGQFASVGWSGLGAGVIQISQKSANGVG